MTLLDPKPHSRIAEFPLFRGRTELFAKLDGFVLTDLVPLIGYERGALLLYQGDYKRIGHIVAAGREKIAEVSGIGPRKLDKIDTYLASLGLTFDLNVSEWLLYRKRFDLLPPLRPTDQTRVMSGRRRRFRVVTPT